MSGDPSPGGPSTAPAGFRRSPTTLLTVGLVALVLVVVVVLVVVKLTDTSPPVPSSGPPPQALTSREAAQVTSVPASVFDAVGVSAPTTPVTRPRALSGSALLKADGRPEVLFVGSEFCPYCAAERWALVLALSRFGRLQNLGTMQSSGNAVFSDIQTFTFATASYKSRYITFVAKERYSDQQNSTGTGFAPLQPLDPGVARLVARYDVPSRTGQPKGAMSFVDVGNRYVAAGAAFSPSVLSGMSRTNVAKGLTDPKDPVTQAIVASANYLTAAICSVDGDRPARVCHSPAAVTATGALATRGRRSGG